MTVGEKSIRVHEFGAGPALLMLHGGGAGANGLSNYGKNIDTLATRFRVIVADMPGYGASTKGLDQADVFGDLARSMIGLLDALGVEQAHVIGNSLGGACALRMALDAPERVERLVLIRHKLILVRADTHVVWRGDGLPADVSALAQQLTGKGSPA